MPDKSDLRPYQHRAIQHIKDQPNCALWLDMGMGKSVSTLTAFSDMQESWDAAHGLVIAPLRVARKTWNDEAEEWPHLRHLKISHILGTEKQRLAALDQKADLHMINRENVAWLRDQFVKGTGKKQKFVRRWMWDTVIIDESSSFKSAKSERFKALRSLRKAYDRCIELTGTPAPNGYQDLWSQINLLDRGKRLGYNQKAFYDRWFDPPDRWDPASNKYTMKDFSKKQIQDALADIVISMKAEDYLDLPPVMMNRVPVYLGAKQLDEYRRMQRTFVMEIAGKKITAMNMGVLTGKLLQLANGAIYTGANKAYEIFHDAKIAELLDVLDQSYGPVLVTAWYQSDMERVREAISHWCKANKKSWDLLTDTASEDRWNSGLTDVLILHPASAGHGLNLHKNDCETIIWYGLTWSLELYQQLNARIAGGHRRIGKNVVIHHILAEGTIDEYVWNVIRDKDATQEELLVALKILVQEIAA